MLLVRLLLAAHTLALLFGLGGMLIALPRPELWAGSPDAIRVFAFGMEHGGAVHMVLGAATMLLVGGRWIGWRKTLIFFGLATSLSLGMELLGTSTGWPFGGYSYLAGLGPKIAGLVPFTIPLSWFYMGFAAWLLASAIAWRLGLRPRTAWAVGLAVWLLTIWDLVLDPAMAHEALPVKFWTWHQTGPYFGMPVENFAGWALTGLLFIGLSRLVWRGDIVPPPATIWIALGIYVVNILFAIVLSLNIGLWQPVVAALVLGVAPAVLAINWARPSPTPPVAMRRSGSG